jgi:hypothetical protein
MIGVADEACMSGQWSQRRGVPKAAIYDRIDLQIACLNYKPIIHTFEIAIDPALSSLENRGKAQFKTALFAEQFKQTGCLSEMVVT